MTRQLLSTRQRYLAYLRKNRRATAEELAHAMNVTSANARHHLSVLQADRLVEVVDFRRESRRGRPVKVFGVNKQLLGDNLPRLADALLVELLGQLESEKAESALDGVAQRVITGSEYNPSNSVSRRLAETITLLNKMNYQARWEAHASGPRVIFESCPYASIIAGHPELCQVDKKILQQLSGKHVEQLAKREKGLKNIPVCIFSLIESI